MNLSFAAVVPVEMWAEHETLPLVTYPYEWPFEYLKQAACLILDLLADALRNGCTLKDASAFNVQFIDTRPTFIDVLLFAEYEEGAPFLGCNGSITDEC